MTNNNKEESLQDFLHKCALWVLESEASADVVKAIWLALEKEGVFKRLGMNTLQIQATSYTLQLVLRRLLQSREIKYDG